MDNWQNCDELQIPDGVAADEEIRIGDSVAQVDVNAMEAIEAVVYDGAEEIVSVEEQQHDALYKELLSYKRRLAELEQKVAALEARLAALE